MSVGVVVVEIKLSEQLTTVQRKSHLTVTGLHLSRTSLRCYTVDVKYIFYLQIAALKSLSASKIIILRSSV